MVTFHSPTHQHWTKVSRHAEETVKIEQPGTKFANAVETIAVEAWLWSRKVQKRSDRAAEER
jgi:hypothetical protein